MDSRRQYLARVYPAANIDVDTDVEQLASNLDVLYTGAPNMSSLEPFHRKTCSFKNDGIGGYNSATAGRSGPGLFTKYLTVLPCKLEVTTRHNIKSTDCKGGCSDCVAQRHQFRPAWATARYLEVRHAALADKFLTYQGSRGGALQLCPSETAFRAGNCTYARSWAAAVAVGMQSPNAAFTDPGPGAMWYMQERGTGIFYDTGRSLSVPTRNEAMAQMAAELAPLPATRAKVCRLLRRRFQPTMSAALYAQTLLGAGAITPADRLVSKLCGSQTEFAALAEGMRRTADGSSHCKEEGILECYPAEDQKDGYDLSDSWDVPMVWIARALKYDTIFYYSSFKVSALELNWYKKDAEMCSISELVDLRLPVPRDVDVIDYYLQLASDPDPSQTLWMHDSYAPKPEMIAKGVTEMASNVLTLRDPLNVEDDSAALPCKVKVGELLSCENHQVSVRASEQMAMRLATLSARLDSKGTVVAAAALIPPS